METVVDISFLAELILISAAFTRLARRVSSPAVLEAVSKV